MKKKTLFNINFGIQNILFRGTFPHGTGNPTSEWSPNEPRTGTPVGNVYIWLTYINIKKLPSRNLKSYQITPSWTRMFSQHKCVRMFCRWNIVKLSFWEVNVSRYWSICVVPPGLLILFCFGYCSLWCFVASSVGSWIHRMGICFCTALLFHVLSSTVFLFDVFYGLYSGGVSV